MNLTAPFNLRPQDIGELIVIALAGSFLLLVLVLSYWRGSPAFRRTTKDMVLLVLVLAVVGIGADMAQVAYPGEGIVDLILVIIEDGGELVVVSFMLWYFFLLTLRKGRPPAYLWDALFQRQGARVRLQESLTGVNGELRAVMTEVQARTSVISLFDWDLAPTFKIAVTGTARVASSELSDVVAIVDEKLKQPKRPHSPVGY